MRNHNETLTRIRLANPEHAVASEEMGLLRAMIDEEISAPSPRRQSRRPTGPMVNRRARAWLVAALAAAAVLALYIPLRYVGGWDGTGHDAASRQSSTASSTTITAPTVDALSLQWRRVEMPGLSGAYLWFSGVTAGGPGLIAVGSPAGSSENGEAFIWTSTDGVEWTPASIAGATGGYAFDVTAGGPGYVAVGSGIWTSPDGNTWQEADLEDRPLSGELYAVAAGGPGLVAVGGFDGASLLVYTSTDGLRWSRIPEVGAPHGGFENQILDVVAGGPGLVAVGHLDGIGTVWTSPDGFDWTPVPHDPEVFGDGTEGTGLFGVAADGSGFVAVGRITDDGTMGIWRSDDGRDWSVVPLDPDVLNEAHELWTVISTEQGLIAGGDGGQSGAGLWFSPDGITWTRLQAGEELGRDGMQVINDITVFGDRVVAVGWELIRPAGSEDSIDSEVVWIGELSQE